MDSLGSQMQSCSLGGTRYGWMLSQSNRFPFSELPMSENRPGRLLHSFAGMLIMIPNEESRGYDF